MPALHGARAVHAARMPRVTPVTQAHACIVPALRGAAGVNMPLPRRCKNIIPYCIATGRRMVLNQWSQCPSCHFPALFDDFTKLLQTDRECPMCNTTVSAAQVQRMSDPVPHLRKHAGMLAAGGGLGGGEGPGGPKAVGGAASPVPLAENGATAYGGGGAEPAAEQPPARASLIEGVFP
mmetsp:Transcript_37669/g.118830  ORF Transcript_37669/g.118830 Transcript_37669/m.118830 type:complete len:179 (+) Transcript_37669:4004-4540(+)